MKSIFGIIFGVVALIASLVFLNCMLKHHDHHKHGHHGDDEMHHDHDDDKDHDHSDHDTVIGGNDDIIILSGFARANGASAKAGAVFFVVKNLKDHDDKLMSAQSDVANMVELHTHTQDENGVMKMGKIEGGIAIPAKGMAMLKRGGNHVMLMGLKQELPHGGILKLQLNFEHAGSITVEVPVDLNR